MVIKTIYILWLQGFKNAPEIVQSCVSSWIDKNPTWNVILLDESTVEKYIDISDIVKFKMISKASMSDVIRISLLKKYGGLWVDATTYCTRPLDDWLVERITQGFFAFNFEKSSNIPPDRPISSWFLYAEKDNYIIDCWYEKTVDYCKNTEIIGNENPESTKVKWLKGKLEEHYFWFHYLFENLYLSDNRFKNIWDTVPKLSEKGPHYIQHSGMLSRITNNVKKHIDFKKTPLYKLTYRFEKEKYTADCSLHYLLYPKFTTMNIAASNYKVKNCIPDIHFIHIGKCGGTALLIAFKEQEIKLDDFHLQKPKKPEKDDKYIIWIRNPLHRFVSAFNFSLALVNTPTKGLKPDSLTIYNCLAPARIRYKMKHDHTFSKKYDDLINFFQTPNCLAEALSSQDEEIKTKALILMNDPLEHINKGIGWYLNNGDFIKENKEKIIFVGKTESMKVDTLNLSKTLGIPVQISKNKIRENASYSKYLSQLAVKNLLNFYHNTDYLALKALHEENWIDNNTYQSYFSY